MKAAVLEALDRITVKEVPTPQIGPDEALVKVRSCAVCGSDIRIFHHGNNRVHPPAILGHESAGEIVAVGANVSGFRVGDRVALGADVPCGECAFCKAGIGNNCQINYAMGYQFQGSFAQYVPLNRTMLAYGPVHKLPCGVTFEEGALAEPLACVLNAVEFTDIRLGDTVVVIGIGPVGLCAVAGARVLGAGRIIAIGTRPNCVKVAKEYGATDIVSYKDGDIVEQILAMTGGKGADRVIIAGGGQEVFGQAVAMTREMGNIANVNFYDVSHVLSMPAYLWGLGMADKNIRGGFCPGGAVRIGRLLEMIRYGRVDPMKLITHEFRGFEKMEDAFLLMDRKEPDLIKPIVYIEG